MNTLGTYLVIAAALFTLGLFGVLRRRNLIGMLISIEMMLNGANVNFMAFNRFLTPEPATGQIVSLFVMGLAAAEAAIGLSIILALFRTLHSINVDRAQEMRG